MDEKENIRFIIVINLKCVGFLEFLWLLLSKIFYIISYYGNNFCLKKRYIIYFERGVIVLILIYKFFSMIF